MPKDDELEIAACTPRPVAIAGFNPSAVLPHSLTIEHLRLAMSDFVNFLGFINTQLQTKEIERLETMLMPANFSSIVGEFMGSSIPKYCSTLAKNQYHNGHPDLIPAGRFPNDAVQHADEGIEIKASRYLRGWQGHNPEDAWLMVFVFDSNRPVDAAKGVAPKPFHKFVLDEGLDDQGRHRSGGGMAFLKRAERRAPPILQPLVLVLLDVKSRLFVTKAGEPLQGREQ
jgi:hypothetical protein